MKVFIVENDRALGLFLQKGLKLEGHDATWVQHGDAALEKIKVSQPDLIVLDLGMSETEGVALVKQIRSLAADAALLTLMGHDDARERVRCLDLGADDCLLKPFSFHELAARCRAILRRRSAHSTPVLRSGALEVDLVQHQVRYRCRRIDLTPKEFALLAFLMRHQGKCCSRQALLQEVWQTSNENAANSVDVYVNYLRRKLDSTDGGTKQRSLIQTIRGEGYSIDTTAASGQMISAYDMESLARGA